MRARYICSAAEAKREGTIRHSVYPNSTENIVIQSPSLDIVRYKESRQDF